MFHCIKKCQVYNRVLAGQTLCILANIADGNTAKDLIMTNDDMLQKIKYYMVRLPSPGTVFSSDLSVVHMNLWSRTQRESLPH